MFNNPYREEAAASRSERQQSDHLLRVTAPNERIVLACAIGMLAAFALWAFFGSIGRSVTLDGILVGPGTYHEVTVQEPGHLMELRVAPGDTVQAGTVIARQTVPELEREIALLRRRVGLLTADIGQAGQATGALRSLFESTDAALLQLEAQRDARERITWHSAGTVTALLAATGTYVSTGTVIAQIHSGEARATGAVLPVTPELARQIEPGMPAEIGIPMPDGTVQLVPGEIVSRSSDPLPRWLEARLRRPAEYSYHVKVALQGPDLPVPDGRACRIRIELAGHRPVDLLFPGDS
ncbi:MAG: hypothetical protein OXG56_12875 [Gammaproteobacteria bacterium]|nr:hypothetical protein [Gammaproteobacteria bacterium]